MTKIIRIAGIFILISSWVAKGGMQAENPVDYEHWLKEEVVLLITDQEEKEFLALASDEDRDRLIAVFWARRDPTPETERNEFKEEWYSRLEHVKKSFTRGVSKGWRSDQGRVYMLFGPPSQTEGRSPRNLEESVGGTQQKLGEDIWFYQPMPELNLFSNFQVVFREYQYGYDLDFLTDQKILRAMEIFPKKVIFNPDLDELPSYGFTLDENSFEGSLISDLITSGEVTKSFALEWRPLFSRASNGDTFVSFLVTIDPRPANKKNFKEMTFFGKIKGNRAEQDFLYCVESIKADEDRIIATFGLPAKPGKSIMFLGARGSELTPHNLLIANLHIPEYKAGELNTSSLILSHEVTTMKKIKKGEGFDPFRIGEFRATPRWGNVFRPSESLNVLYLIYNPLPKEEMVSLLAEYFLTGNEVAYKLNPQDIRQKIEEGKAIAGGTQIALSPLKPGKYTFRIKLTDRNAGKAILKEKDFYIE